MKILHCYRERMGREKHSELLWVEMSKLHEECGVCVPFTYEELVHRRNSLYWDLLLVRKDIALLGFAYLNYSEMKKSVRLVHMLISPTVKRKRKRLHRIMIVKLIKRARESDLELCF